MVLVGQGPTIRQRKECLPIFRLCVFLVEAKRHIAVDSQSRLNICDDSRPLWAPAGQRKLLTAPNRVGLNLPILGLCVSDEQGMLYATHQLWGGMAVV